MKKLILVLLLVIPCTLFAQNATIKIDVDRTVGKIDPKIYGVFMEPIHFSGERMGLPDTVDMNTLYGTLYDPSSQEANEDGFIKPYIEAMKELQVTNMRWPGGNYAMAYDWRDGIGPKDQRPSRINMAWGSTDNNHVGTDEWVELNQAMGSQNVVCVNLGLGTIKNAAHWVEYANYESGTHYSDLRAKYGHPQPYDIKIWDLGNEVDGTPWELGHKNADDYVKVAREAAKAMRAVDHSIQLVASGSSYYESTGQWVDWNRKILEGLGDRIQYLSIHRYWENSDDYYDYMGQSAMDFEEKIKITADEIEAVSTMKDYEDPIYISVDEWGTFGQNFRAVLPTAQAFNAFLRHADVVKMANYTLMTSLLQRDRDKGYFKSPLFYTFKLFSNNARGKSVDTYVKSGTFDTDAYKAIPYLDVTTTYSEETHTAYINVVNRHKDKAITADILNTSGELAGRAEARIVNQDSLEAPFTYDKRDQYKPVEKEIKSSNNRLTYTFPPHSFTQIKIGVMK